MCIILYYFCVINFITIIIYLHKEPLQSTQLLRSREKTHTPRFLWTDKVYELFNNRHGVFYLQTPLVLICAEKSHMESSEHVQMMSVSICDKKWVLLPLNTGRWEQEQQHEKVHTRQKIIS